MSKTKIIDEVRQISSEKIAEKKRNSENNYPKLIEKIKQSAAFGQTQCEFREDEIDQYSKKLLEADGFSVYATTETPSNKYDNYLSRREPKSIWKVTW